MFVASVIGAQIPSQGDSIEKYWREGEKRIYRFMIGDLDIGRLEAVMDDIDKKDGRLYYEIKEKLILNFTEQERSFVFGADGRLSVNDAGYFLSGEVEVRVDDRKEKIEASFDAKAGEIIARRGDEEAGARKISASGPVYALDNYMLDQFELALMSHTFLVGKPIIIPALSIQGMYAAEYEFAPVGKVQVQYGAFTDSVWQIDLVRPARASFYIDRGRRIVKWVDHDRDLTAEVVIDPFAKRGAPQKSLVEHINDHMIRLPIYGIYLLMAAIWLLFLGRDSYRLKWSYLLFILGGLAYPLIYITQAPLQESYATNVLAPAMGAGESIIIPAVIPALLTGLIQETLKFIPLLLIARFLRPNTAVLISLGAFIGAGFGWVEACHIIAPMFQARVLTGYALIERVFTIMFHVTMGAALGYGLGRRKIWQFWLAAVGLHAFANYLIVFVQLKMLTIKGINIILGLYDMALLAGMVYLRNVHKASQRMKKKKKQ
jgi:hypothetical protein